MRGETSQTDKEEDSIALVVLLADGIASLFPTLDVLWIRLVCFMILTPTLFIPVRHLSYTSLIGIMSILCLLCVILYDGLTKPSAPGSLIEPAVSQRGSWVVW